MKTHSTRVLFMALLIFCSLGAHIASAAENRYAVVDGVQMPAWVERNGVRQALEPGMPLRNRDRILTGADARVLIQLAEGSAVKLGENAQLDLNALGRRQGGVFTAALDVAKGAFRFTTGVFARTHRQRAVNVRIATITAGIRGTDLWGSSDSERDLVCLLEGRITVMHPDDGARLLSEPLSVYAAAKGQAPQGIGSVDRAQADIWAAQTEIQAESGFVRRGGAWKVELAVVDGEYEALALYDRARAAGYAVRIQPRAAESGGYRYALRVTRLPSRAEAAALASKLAVVLQLPAPEVKRY